MAFSDIASKISTIKWDVEKIGEYISGLRPQIQILEDNKGFLSNLKTEVNAAWQGYAGTAFDEVMEFDIDNYEKLKNLLDDFCKDVETSQKGYQNCEDEIRGLITTLKSTIG